MYVRVWSEIALSRLNGSRRVMACFEAYGNGTKRHCPRIHANLPYTYRNPKYGFFAIFIFKYWSEHFGLIHKVVEFVKTHLFCKLIFHANPTVLLQ